MVLRWRILACNMCRKSEMNGREGGYDWTWAKGQDSWWLHFSLAKKLGP